MPTKPTEKRQSPNPTDEDLAIRALREVRAFDASLAKLEQQVTDKRAERKELLDGLPDEAKRILAMLQGK